MAYVKRGQKELRKDWPFTSGLTAETETQKGRVENLVASEGTLVLRRNRVGIE